ncbi:MAG: hotdog fold thioesterase [Aeromonas sp.]
MSHETAPIWRKPVSLDELNATSVNTLMAHLEIVYTAVGPNWLEATMPVDSRTHQPLGMLHGGASVVLAETLGSLAANLAVGLDSYCVGLEVNANHVRAKRDGVVTGRCSPLHLGATTQVWQIEILDEQKRLVCTSRLTMAVLKHKSHR